MNNDRLTQLIRYFLIAGGMGLAAWWGAKLTPEQASNLADQIIAVMPALISIGAAIWGLVVKSGTVAVPTETVRASEINPNVPTIPTVSPVTGAVQIGTADGQASRR